MHVRLRGLYDECGGLGKDGWDLEGLASMDIMAGDWRAWRRVWKVFRGGCIVEQVKGLCIVVCCKKSTT